MISREGEDALRRVNALAAFAAHASNGSEPAPGRLESDRTTDPDRRIVRESVVLRCVSVTEAYLTDLGKRLLADRLTDRKGDDVLFEFLREAQNERLNQGNWNNLVALWEAGLGVPIKSFPGYSAIVNFRTTRHAIAHRYGEMTPLYRKQLAHRLKAEGYRDPRSADGLVLLNDSDVNSAISITRGFVRYVELEVSPDREPMDG